MSKAAVLRGDNSWDLLIFLKKYTIRIAWVRSVNQFSRFSPLREILDWIHSGVSCEQRPQKKWNHEDLNEDLSNGFIENSTESKCLPILSRISYETDMMIWRVQRRIRVAEVRWGEVRVARTQMSVTGDEALLIIIHTVSRPLDPRAVGLTVRRQSKFTPLHLLLQPLIALNSLYSWSRFFVSLRSDLNLIIWFLVVLKYPFLLCNAFINFFSLTKRFFA